MTGRRYDWEALQGEYTAAGNDMTPEPLTTWSGVSLNLLSRRVKAENWGWVQAFYRLGMRAFRRSTFRNAGASAVFDALWTRPRRRTLHCKGEGQP